jgi:hypothetical protein
MSEFVAQTAQRVPEHTSEEVNARIQASTVRRLNEIGADRGRIDRRLRELDREWDIERAIEANASSLALIGLALGASVDRKWFALPGIVAGFLFQHAIQGWCPPVPVLRRLGFRTQREIHDERTLLLARKENLNALAFIPPADALTVLTRASSATA